MMMIYINDLCFAVLYSILFVVDILNAANC